MIIPGKTYQVIIIGGGIAGLTTSIALARAGADVLVIEKKHYPFHRVCGEYISNEVIPYLQSIGTDPAELHPAKISRLLVSSPSGKALSLELDLGGMGISRYTFDYFLFTKAKEAGVHFLLDTSVTSVRFEEELFSVDVDPEPSLKARLVIGSFGKRSNLDRKFSRPFFFRRSPYIGVKYHIRYDFPDDLIALHNFKDGYCGISKTESDRYCFCYLTTRENLRNAGNIPEMERKWLYKNPFLRKIFQEAEFLFDKPEVINEISFEIKEPVFNHILMGGDAAGMIAPLCGNGMAMAVHSSKILTDKVLRFLEKEITRQQLEKEYSRQWKRLFYKRLWVGRSIQNMFGKEALTDVAISFLTKTKPLADFLVRNTHGKPF